MIIVGDMVVIDCPGHRLHDRTGQVIGANAWARLVLVSNEIAEWFSTSMLRFVQI